METMLAAMWDGFLKSLIFIIPQIIYLAIILKKETKMIDSRDAVYLDRNDKGKIEVYSEKEDGINYIFGVNSGFAYASPIDPEEWMKDHKEFI